MKRRIVLAASALAHGSRRDGAWLALDFLQSGEERFGAELERLRARLR